MCLPWVDTVGSGCSTAVGASVTIVHDLRIEPVSQTPNVQQKPGPRRIRFDLPAQTHDVVVDDAVVERDVTAPGGVEQLLAREHPPAAADEYRQQLEL